MLHNRMISGMRCNDDGNLAGLNLNSDFNAYEDHPRDYELPVRSGISQIRIKYEFGRRHAYPKLKSGPGFTCIFTKCQESSRRRDVTFMLLILIELGLEDIHKGYPGSKLNAVQGRFHRSRILEKTRRNAYTKHSCNASEKRDEVIHVAPLPYASSHLLLTPRWRWGSTSR
jgi:hypothetical protein